MDNFEKERLEERAGQGLFNAALARGINFSEAIGELDSNVIDFLLLRGYVRRYEERGIFSITKAGRDYAVDYINRQREAVDASA